MPSLQGFATSLALTSQQNLQTTRSGRTVKPSPKACDIAASMAKNPLTQPAGVKKALGRPKKTKAPEAPTTNGTAKHGRKRKDENEVSAAPPPAKKARVVKTSAPKAAKPKTIINERSTQRLDVYVFGEGSNSELGLGAAKNAIDVKRPRLNPFLSSEAVGVVSLACGGMHVLALTHDGKVLSWGVNDNGALGRDTAWDGGMKDIDDDKSDDSDDSDSGLNPHESTPTVISSFPEGTNIVKVAAGDSISLALTDDGLVYGWGTFRVSQVLIIPRKSAANRPTEQFRRPRLLPRSNNHHTTQQELIRSHQPNRNPIHSPPLHRTLQNHKHHLRFKPLHGPLHNRPNLHLGLRRAKPTRAPHQRTPRRRRKSLPPPLPSPHWSPQIQSHLHRRRPRLRRLPNQPSLLLGPKQLRRHRNRRQRRRRPRFRLRPHHSSLPQQ